jgi:hypothetical protein
VAASAAAVLLAGCTSTVAGQALFGGDDPAKPTVPPAGLGGPDPAADPVVGGCYVITSGQNGEALDPPDPVDCSTTHNAETAAVDDSGLGEDDAYPTQDDVDDDSSTVYAALDDICSFDLLSDYLGGDDLDDPYAFFSAYLPNQEQWDAGARWVRCDVFYGYTSPENAPGVMADALQGAQAAAYRACFSGNPADWDVVPCSQPHEAEPIGSYADVADGAPYPADPAARQALAAQCASGAADYVGAAPPPEYVLDVYVGSPSDWSSDPFAQCVLTPAAGGQTTTSVRR